MTARARSSISSPASQPLQRGYNVIAVDGPGQASALIEHGLTLRPDWENVIAPMIDHLIERPEVDPDRIAVIGLSLGAHLAPRAASARAASRRVYRRLRQLRPLRRGARADATAARTRAARRQALGAARDPPAPSSDRRQTDGRVGVPPRDARPRCREPAGIPRLPACVHACRTRSANHVPDAGSATPKMTTSAPPHRNSSTP